MIRLLAEEIIARGETIPFDSREIIRNIADDKRAERAPPGAHVRSLVSRASRVPPAQQRRGG
jgi:hypothetical protein